MHSLTTVIKLKTMRIRVFNRIINNRLNIVSRLLSTAPGQSSETISAHSFSEIPKPTFSTFISLTKPKLSSLVVLTTVIGSIAAPISPSLLLLIPTTIGTSLCVASANVLNQFMESPFDAQMKRTRNRPIVGWIVTPWRAFLFGSTLGVSGVSILTVFVNPLTAALGGFNILMYAGVYTIMKRYSVYNTHAGAIVGAIPPIMVNFINKGLDCDNRIN